MKQLHYNQEKSPKRTPANAARKAFWDAAMGDNSKLANLAKAAIAEAEQQAQPDQRVTPEMFKALQDNLDVIARAHNRHVEIGEKYGITGEAQPDEQANRQEVGPLAKHQPCGCVICTCEDEEQCHGCGAKHCGKHPIGQIQNPLYTTPPAQPAREWVGHDRQHIIDAFAVARDRYKLPTSVAAFQEGALFMERALKSGAYPEATAAAQPAREWVGLSDAELDLCREWFDNIQDVNGGYLTPTDYALAEKLYLHLGIRVPSSISDVLDSVPAESKLREKNAGLPAAVPDGYVLVPVEPTDDMVLSTITTAGNYTREQLLQWSEAEWARDAYRAMLAAAQKPQDDLPTILKKQAS